MPWMHPPDTKDQTWTFPCLHPNHLSAGITNDFTQLAIGGEDIHPQQKNWRGRFTGRPSLLADLMPVIRASYAKRSPTQVIQLLASMRQFWRFLDSYEEFCAKSQEEPLSVGRLHHVSGTLLELFSQHGPQGAWSPATYTSARLVRGLIRDAVFNAELPELHIAALIDTGRQPKETPGYDESMALIRELRTVVLQIYRRWQRADRLAKEGRDLLKIPDLASEKIKRTITEADAHATYRALIDRLNCPLPTWQMLTDALHLKTFPISWWPRYGNDPGVAGKSPGDMVTWIDMEAGLYANSRDVSLFFLLFLARTAWNPATAAGLDINDWSSEYDAEYRWLYSRKERAGGSYQHAISQTRHVTGPFALVQNLITRNAPLRELIHKVPGLDRSPDLALRSPWIGPELRGGGRLFIVNMERTTTVNNHLEWLIDQHNAVPSKNIKLPKITCGDFRDIAAAAMYRESRYSSWVLMLMLGHSNLATTHRYGYRQAGREESDRLVVDAVHDVFEQIQTHRIWDPALTRARVEGIELSPKAIAELVEYRKNRTYDGTLCTSPRNPPKEIDPTHPQDGRAICAQQHRCASAVCPRAIVLNDSITLLARRVAELEWNQLHMGLVRFHTASDAHDLQVLRATLRQWPESKFSQHLAHWRDQIERGLHRPIQIGGRH